MLLRTKARISFLIPSLGKSACRRRMLGMLRANEGGSGVALADQVPGERRGEAGLGFRVNWIV
jgi:hypothetical protein